MTNNILEIIGDDNQVKEVRNFLKGKTQKGNEMYIDFNNIIPMPEEIKNAMHENGDWDNWDTKWNAFDQSSPKPNEIRFTTAWNPIPDLIKEVSKRFPYVIFIYHFTLSDVLVVPEVSLFIKNDIETEIPQECFLPGEAFYCNN